jgi:hypothetical protein
MRKFLVALTTVSALGLYTASGAYASCDLTLGSCNGTGNGTTTVSKSVDVDKTTEVDITKISVPIGSNNNNGAKNTSGVLIGGNGNFGNSIQQTGNTSVSYGGRH